MDAKAETGEGMKCVRELSLHKTNYGKVLSSKGLHRGGKRGQLALKQQEHQKA
jgi:hypothetical protein